MFEDDDEVLAVYVEESREHLDGIIDDLLQIEKDGADIDDELVNQVFRTLHSIKGGAGFFALEEVQALAHVMESILDRFRQKSLVPDSSNVSTLLDAADLLTTMINDIQASKNMDIDDHLKRLQAILDEEGVAPEADDKCAPEAAANPDEAPETSAERSDTHAEIFETSERGAIVFGDATDAPDETAPATVTLAADNTDRDSSAAPASKQTVEQSIRVNIGLLDRLMVLAGEMVLARNELIRSADTTENELIQSSVQSVNLITSELQEAIMSTRMQAVGIVFNKFKRVVRDLSNQMGKSIALHISGEDVDMDKTIIEAIGDPLTHLIRNSIDHGIETPEERVKRGKPEQGELRLHAFHSAGQVVIEIRDDGAGINYERIKAKALSNGLHTREELERMSDKEIAHLIFKPGFSTAEKVTDISGRGVGMDVVQRNLSKVGGVIDMDSEFGKGTTISIKLPLTLAIIPSLLVELGQKTFAIPQVNLVELVRVVPGDDRNRLERIGESEVLRIRGQVLPVVRLGQVLSHDDPEGDAAALGRPTSVVIVAAGDFKYGIIVDRFLDSAEIVVKPLGKHFSQSREYAGATILGDGTVALILDVAGIRTVSNLKETVDPVASSLIEDDEEKTQSDLQTMLLLRHNADETFAIPSYLVSRIERVTASAVQQIGDARAIRYFDDTLQLVSLDRIPGCKPCDLSDDFFTVVVNVSGIEFGIVSTQVTDIIETTSAIDDHSYVRAGVMGSFTLGDTIVQLLDIHELMKIGAPELFNHLTSWKEAESEAKVLLVEDSPFFQRQIANWLKQSGFEVLLANDGVEGLELLDANHDIELIVSDIEMPRMNGFEMVRAIRSKKQWTNLPIIAVTSLAAESARQEGYDSGFDDYQVKLDRDRLLIACTQLTANQRAA